MTEIDDKGKLLEAFHLVFSRTGKIEASIPDLIRALREVNPLLRNRSNVFIRKMIDSNSRFDDLSDDMPSRTQKRRAKSV